MVPVTPAIKRMFFLGTFASIVSAIIFSLAGRSQPLDTYFKRKAEIIQSLMKRIEPKFESDLFFKESSQAEIELKHLLELYLGKSQFRKKVDEETYQPASILPEGFSDSGCIDGIWYWIKAPHTSILVSALPLINRVQNRIQSNFDKFSEETIDLLICNDAHFSQIVELASIEDNRFDKIYASLGFTSQDTGPVPVDTLFILARRGVKIYAIHVPLPVQHTPAYNFCKKKWDSANPAFDDKNFSEYLDCYRSNLKKDQAILHSFRKQANSALELIQ